MRSLVLTCCFSKVHLVATRRAGTGPPAAVLIAWHIATDSYLSTWCRQAACREARRLVQYQRRLWRNRTLVLVAVLIVTGILLRMLALV